MGFKDARITFVAERNSSADSPASSMSARSAFDHDANDEGSVSESLSDSYDKTPKEPVSNVSASKTAMQDGQSIQLFARSAEMHRFEEARAASYKFSTG